MNYENWRFRIWLIGIAASVTLIPSFAFSQKQQTKVSLPRPMASLLRPVFQKIHHKVMIPILFPSKLPAGVDEQEIHFVDGEATNDEYKITLAYKSSCGNACFVGFFAARRGDSVSATEVDRIVRLANGLKGHYTARSCGGSCTPPEINWIYKNTLYTIQFKVNGHDDKQDEGRMIALANSAILGGER